MITGGGTGGHTSPALAIVQELRRHDPKVVLQWVGRKGAIEERVSAVNGVPFVSVPGEGWPRGNRLRRLWVAFKLMVGVLRAAWVVRRFRPDVVIGVGGYVALPVVWAAQRLRVPTVIHEQNKRLGMTNRILARRAARIFLSYENTLGRYPKDKALVAGNPVRAGFADPPSMKEARQTFGLDLDVPVVLVSGGSQGARTLNQAMSEALAHFAAREVQFIWMTGKADYEQAQTAASKAPARVKVFAFIDDMVSACASADLIVSRAGASSTAEISVLGKPSILIPYRFATDNHQEQNARAFEEAGAAILLSDDACTGATLTQIIRDTLADKERLSALGRAATALAKPAAGKTIVAEVVRVCSHAT